MFNTDSLSVMLLFAMVPAAVSIYSQRTLAGRYSPRTVAEINTHIFEIGLRTSSVTQSTVTILFKAEPPQSDFWLKLRPVDADHCSETAGRHFGDDYEGRGYPHVEKHCVFVGFLAQLHTLNTSIWVFCWVFWDLPYRMLGFVIKLWVFWDLPLPW